MRTPKLPHVHVAHRSVAEPGGVPIATEVIAEAIVEISQAMKKIREGRLNEKALIVLIKHDTSESVTAIKNVLNSLEWLEEVYLNKKDGAKKSR